jgi:hypothetical protein
MPDAALLTTQLQPHAPIAIILRVFLITTVDQSKNMLPATHNLHLSQNRALAVLPYRDLVESFTICLLVQVVVRFVLNLIASITFPIVLF